MSMVRVLFLFWILILDWISSMGKDFCENDMTFNFFNFFARRRDSSLKYVGLNTQPSTGLWKNNKKWAHYQVAQWYASFDSVPQPLDPRNYGWEADNPNRTLWAVTLAATHIDLHMSKFLGSLKGTFQWNVIKMVLYLLWVAILNFEFWIITN